MVCSRPKQAVLLPFLGKRRISFKKCSSLPKGGEFVSVPCGYCVFCRLSRARSWAIRIMNETQMSGDSCFITLTYADEYLPEGKTLVKKHFVDFMRRLRKKFGVGIRYFQCGEYGDKYGRPHYHAIIFNLDFPDKRLVSESIGYKLYDSEILSRLWTFKGAPSPIGMVRVGSVTFESAAYVARYVMKKRYGDSAVAHYAGREPEYCTMSRMPGIGLSWFKKFWSDVYPRDEMPVKGKNGIYVTRPPRYYDRLLESDNPSLMAEIKLKRKEIAKKPNLNNHPDRLVIRELKKSLDVQKLIRQLD